MKSSYKRIGDYIHKVEERNTGLKVTKLVGLSMTKEFRETTSNIIGTDMSVYKIVRKWQFSCDFMSVIRVNKLPVVLKTDDEPVLVSPAYPVFEVNDPDELHPEFLMMWLRRPELDRYAVFKCDSAIRGGYGWEELCDTKLPVPHMDKQKEIIKEYNVILNRIALNNQLIENLEATAQAIFMQWFVDFEFQDVDGQPYKSSNGEMEFNSLLEKEIPKGWIVESISNLIEIKDGTHDSPKPVMKGFPLVTSTHLKPYDIALDETYNISFEDYVQTNKRSGVDKHDILFSMIGTIGLISYVLYERINFAIKNVGLFKTSKNREFAEYILFYLKSDYMKNRIFAEQIGGVQDYVTLTFLRAIPIVVPPCEIVLEFQNISSKLINKISLVVNEQSLLVKLKDILLSKLAIIESIP